MKWLRVLLGYRQTEKYEEAEVMLRLEPVSQDQKKIPVQNRYFLLVDGAGFEPATS